MDAIKESMIQADDARRAAEMWNGEIARLRAALAECAADWKSPPCTVVTAASHLSHEFSRRMQIAADALEYVAGVDDR